MRKQIVDTDGCLMSILSDALVMATCILAIGAIFILASVLP